MLREQLKDTITHTLRVEGVSIEWAVKKHDYAHSKSERCEYQVAVKKYDYAPAKSRRYEY